MNKLLVSTALVAALSAAPFVSHAADGRAFADLGAGRANFTNSGLSKHTVNAFAIKGGYRWALSDSFSLGAEGGYLRSARAHGTSSRTTGHQGPDLVTGPGPAIGQGATAAVHPHATLSSRNTLRLDGPFVGANARMAFGGDFFATAELGAFRAHSRLTIDTTVVSSLASNTVGSNVSRHERNTHRIDAFAGVGVGYAISPNLDVSLNFDRFQVDRRNGGSVNLAAVDVGVRF
ncbi:MAG: outer membrane beta-barrel protein [Luteibacter jiangsuensis]